MSPKRYQKIDPQVANKIYSKTDGNCYYCGQPLPDDQHILDHGGKIVITIRRWHVDHRQPVAKGGTDAIENLVPACRTCNLRKHDKTEDEFREEFSV